MASKSVINRRNSVKRADRINYLKSLRGHDTKHKTFKATMKV